MDVLTLFLTAVGLSMDAFAVSISNSMCYRGIRPRQVTANALCFGLAQGVMPTIGFFAGRLLGGFITSIDHWLALVLLGIIGGKMVLEGIKALRHPEDCPDCPEFTVKTMLMQALATSIDALAVGIGFAAFEVNIWLAAGLIAATTLVICLLGGALGKRVGALLGDWAQIFGGLLLVGIGLKIFIDHADHVFG